MTICRRFRSHRRDRGCVCDFDRLLFPPISSYPLFIPPSNVTNLPSDISNILPRSYYKEHYKMEDLHEIHRDFEDMQLHHERILAKTLDCYRSHVTELERVIRAGGVNKVGSGGGRMPGNHSMPGFNADTMGQHPGQIHNGTTTDMGMSGGNWDPKNWLTVPIQETVRSAERAFLDVQRSFRVAGPAQRKGSGPVRGGNGPNVQAQRHESLMFRMERLAIYGRHMLLENARLHKKVNLLERQRDRVLALRGVDPHDLASDFTSLMNSKNTMDRTGDEGDALGVSTRRSVGTSLMGTATGDSADGNGVNWHAITSNLPYSGNKSSGGKSPGGASVGRMSQRTSQIPPKYGDHPTHTNGEFITRDMLQRSRESGGNDSESWSKQELVTAEILRDRLATAETERELYRLENDELREKLRSAKEEAHLRFLKELQNLVDRKSGIGEVLEGNRRGALAEDVLLALEKSVEL